EAERGAAEGDAEHGEALRVAVREDQVGNADRGEDDQPAHRRRAGLGVVLLRAVLTDVLAELLHPQVLDELGAEEDADQHRRHAGDQHLAHQSNSASVSATASRPAEREPLTRIASPGSSWAASNSAASAGSPTSSSGSYSRAGSPTPISRSTPSARAWTPTSRW